MRYAHRVIPAAFQSRRALRVLNVAAVGFALAAATSGVFACLFHRPNLTAFVTALPTWIIGTLWALVLRWPKTIGQSSFRWGWAASVPLAILNASVAAGLLFALDTSMPDASRFVLGALLGATIGALAWVPALITTLVCFGIPIASAQRLAQKGLAGEERGEWMVGIACVVMSVLGLLLSFGARVPHWDHAPGLWLSRAFAMLGILGGGAATLFARAREARRRRFVADAEAGKAPGYRIDETDEGKVLVRIVSQGEGYRVADFEEELFELDAEGAATRPKALHRG